LAQVTEIETVTVTFEEFKAHLQHYLKVKEVKRVVVMRGDEVGSVMGPWLPGEERFLAPEWFFDELFGPEPYDPNDPYPLSRALEDLRDEERTST
jgi:hypothetical protein